MPRYIDADELIKAMNTWDKFGFSHSGAFVREPKNDDYVPYVHYDDMVKCVKGMTTANVRENVHARFVSEIIKKEDWKGLMQSYYQPNSCSNCHTALTGKENFCPNCGAEMEKDNVEVH